MTRSLIVLIVSVLFTGSASRSFGGEIPEPCAKVGYLTETLGTSFREGVAFDGGGTYAPGFQWYRWNFFNVRPDRESAKLNSEGSLTVSGGLRDSLKGNVTSAARIPRPPGFVGKAFGGGACVEVVLRFNPKRGVPGKGHPAFWAMSFEHLAQTSGENWPGQGSGFKHFAEWDIFEYYKVPIPGFLSSWIDWYGQYSRKKFLAPGEKGCTRPYCKIARSFEASPNVFPSETNWLEWQTIIGVWIPATADSQGSIQTFFNGKAISSAYNWRPASDGRAKFEENLDFSIVDKQHLVFVIGSGENPMFVRSVRVFQKNSDGNLSN